MGNEIEKSKIDQINKMHRDNENHAQKMIHNAIQIGQLLSEQKESLEHGEWIPWVKDNLCFDARQAQRYMRAYQNRDKIDTTSMTHLSQAMQQLSEPRKKEHENRIEKLHREREHALEQAQYYAEQKLIIESELGRYASAYDKLEELNKRNAELKKRTDELKKDSSLEEIETISEQWTKLFSEYYELRDVFPEYSFLEPLSEWQKNAFVELTGIFLELGYSFEDILNINAGMKKEMIEKGLSKEAIKKVMEENTGTEGEE